MLAGSISETVARATSGCREWMGQLSGPPTASEDKSGGRMPLPKLGQGNKEVRALPEHTGWSPQTLPPPARQEEGMFPSRQL